MIYRIVLNSRSDISWAFSYRYLRRNQINTIASIPLWRDRLREGTGRYTYDNAMFRNRGMFSRTNWATYDLRINTRSLQSSAAAIVLGPNIQLGAITNHNGVPPLAGKWAPWQGNDTADRETFRMAGKRFAWPGNVFPVLENAIDFARQMVVYFPKFKLIGHWPEIWAH